MQFSGRSTQNLKSASLQNLSTDTFVRVNLRTTLHDDGTTCTKEAYDNAVARTWPTDDEHGVGGVHILGD